jgi:hypothetical protein
VEAYPQPACSDHPKPGSQAAPIAGKRAGVELTGAGKQAGPLLECSRLAQRHVRLTLPVSGFPVQFPSMPFRRIGAWKREMGLDIMFKPSRSPLICFWLTPGAQLAGCLQGDEVERSVAGFSRLGSRLPSDVFLTKTRRAGACGAAVVRVNAHRPPDACFNKKPLRRRENFASMNHLC